MLKLNCIDSKLNCIDSKLYGFSYLQEFISILYISLLTVWQVVNHFLPLNCSLSVCTLVLEIIFKNCLALLKLWNTTFKLLSVCAFKCISLSYQLGVFCSFYPFLLEFSLSHSLSGSLSLSHTHSCFTGNALLSFMG